MQVGFTLLVGLRQPKEDHLQPAGPLETEPKSLTGTHPPQRPIPWEEAQQLQQ